MKHFIILFIIGFLKQDIGSDPGLMQLPVILHGGGRDIHIDSSDRSVLMLDGINGMDAVQDIFYGIVHRILTGFNGQTLMSHILQGNDFTGYLLLGQLLPRNMLVLQMIRAVQAPVHAVVG